MYCVVNLFRDSRTYYVDIYSNYPTIQSLPPSSWNHNSNHMVGEEGCHTHQAHPPNPNPPHNAI